jgi:hypothetical protein
MIVRQIVVALLLGVAGRAHAQLDISAVPVSVRQAWAAKYSGPVVWRPAPGATYDAAFTVRGVPTVAHYAAGGQLVETRVTIGAVDMPSPVRAAVTRELKWYQLRDAWRVDVAGGGMQYQVEADSAGQVATLRFTADGRFLTRSSRARHN